MSERRIILNTYHAPLHCKKCGADMKFMGVGTYMCEKCHFEDYDDYGIVRNYVENHKGASVGQVSEATGVDQREINDMLREERLEISIDSKVFLKCDGCGKEIRFGRYCIECSRLATAARAKKEKEKERKEHQQNMNISGSVKTQEVAQGAKRFERGL